MKVFVVTSKAHALRLLRDGMPVGESVITDRSVTDYVAAQNGHSRGQRPVILTANVDRDDLEPDLAALRSPQDCMGRTAEEIEATLASLGRERWSVYCSITYCGRARVTAPVTGWTLIS